MGKMMLDSKESELFCMTMQIVPLIQPLVKCITGFDAKKGVRKELLTPT